MNTLDTPLFATQNGKAFYRGQPIRGADAASFQQVLADWALDSKRVYHGLSNTQIDVTSFKPLNAIFAVDKEHAYCCRKMLTSADPSSFRVYDSGVYFHDGAGMGANLYRGYAGDSANVWTYCLDGIYKVRGADPATLVSFGNEFAADKDHVFFGHSKIPGVERASWRCWKDWLSIDSENIFWTSKKIPDVDRASVSLLAVRDAFVDRNHIYCQDQRINFDEYIELLDLLEQRCQLEREWLKSGEYFRRILTNSTHNY